jgi:hypothetical protein
VAKRNLLFWFGDEAMRKKSPELGATCLSDLGSHQLVFDEREVVQLLRAAIEREGNQVAFAKRHGLERSHLNMVLNGKRPVSSNIVKALGLHRVYAFDGHQ